MLTLSQRILKRTFDFVLAAFGLLFTWWIIVIAWLIASFETRSNGLFVQKRVGKDGKLFDVYKIKTMKKVSGVETTITSANDARITKSGAFFRKTKIDELPQLVNVLFGSMSFVGPRPDVSGYADMLQCDDKIVLSIKPGITGPASLKYKDEEEILAKQNNPTEYNDTIIWPDKVKINKKYIKNWSLKKDIIYIIKTITG
jgi:lipopolysaccharide/colanic/teichoic acid biosynthesis glycosyltransferase